MKILSVFILLLLLLLSSVSHIQAEEVSIGIYPAISLVKASSNAQITVPITVANASDQQLNVQISFRGFEPDTTGSSVSYFSEENVPKALATLLSKVVAKDGEVTINTINLYPNESKVVNISIPTIENNAQEYYFAAVFSSVPQNSESESTIVKISPSVASLIFLSVNESSNMAPEISSFHTDMFHSSGPVEFDLKTTNTGNHFKILSGTIYVYNMFGGEAGKIEIPSYIITANKSKEAKMKNGQDIIWKEKFPFGFYTAKAVMSYENAPTVTKEVRFMVLPIFMLIIITIVLFFILGVTLRVIRKINLKEK